MNRDKDAKRQVLRKNGTLNPRLDRVKSELFTDNEFFDAADLMQIKYEMVRAAEQQGRPISKVAKEFGLSRPAFYHAQQAFREQGLAGLLPRKRGPKSSYKLTGEALAFVEQQDILDTFEGLVRYLFKEIKGVEIEKLPLLPYEEAMKKYGSDKPDLRFGMEFVELNDVAQGKGFKVFDDVALVVGINVEGCADYSRKQLDKLTDFVRRPQIGANGLVYVKYNVDGTFKSSVDKFFSQEDLQTWADKFDARPGDLMLVMAGEADKTRKQLSELRLEMGEQLNLRNPNVFKPLWVVDFPLLEWDEESGRYHAMHHPFTSPKQEHEHLLDTDPGKVNANAYDLVINGVEIGGGSIRIHNRELQKKMFQVLGFTDEEAQAQFGFLMNAFEYGAPPHGGIALGFDRLVALFAGQDSIRDFIAFPKNNAGRDVMIDSPSVISGEQLEELGLKVEIKQNKD